MNDLMQDFLFNLMSFFGILIMFISLINMWNIDKKNKKSEQKKNKSKHVKLLIFGLIVYVLSRILDGHFP
ncbi:hypothetical protein EI200_23710 [Peribacillus simplex]|uniref:hypothetical protein n=1 Tax=Peribacillus simplex TaxID=1478 RepID=UPI000F6419B3|nr:hypothetical protein [Peribacillus simplex]RRN67166.1 hypothetical protein EI200_23710 [Peribacillus simplex]